MIDPLVITGITCLSSLLVLCVLGSLSRAHMPGVTLWSTASALLALGMALIALRGQIPNVLSIVLGNLMVYGATLCEYAGARRFFGKKPALPWLCACLSLWLAGLLIWTYIDDNIRLRIVLGSLLHGLVLAALAWLVARNCAPGRTRYGIAFTAGMSVLTALGMFARAIVFARNASLEHGIHTITPLNILLLSLGTLAMPAITLGMVMLVHDRLSAALESSANQDFLTQVLNRRALMASIERIVTRSLKEPAALSLAIFDIDHFKLINDSHGHAAGDEVLKHFTRVITSHLHERDRFGRLGGEEFAMLVRDADGHRAVRRIEGIRTALAADACRFGTLRVRYTFSAGVAQLARGESLDQWFSRADAALYAAKAAGRNRIWAGDARLPSSVQA